MDAAENFIKHFNKSYKKILGKQKSSEKNFFISEFVDYIPEFMAEMQRDIDDRKISNFYIKLNNLKYLIEFSDELNKCWYILRAYSGGLKKLLETSTIEEAKKIHQYYVDRYGGRRVLKDENWFEEKRWAFLDQLKELKTNKSLNLFIEFYIEKLNEYFASYKKEILQFRNDIKRLLK